MNNIKQLRFRIISGIDIVGKISYGRSFDLMNARDYSFLKKECKKNVIRGFSIEISSYKKGEYDINRNQKEFQTIIEYLVAENKGNYFLFMDKLFKKMQYHIITDSILDVNQDLRLLINAIVPGDIDEIMCAIEEMFGKQKDEKVMKIDHLIRKNYKY